MPAVRHALPSMVFSLDDEPFQPSRRLLGLAARLAAATPEVEHPLLAARTGDGRRWYTQFPGEHYHLLTAICRELRPSVVWEFGTDTGMSTVAMLEGLSSDARIVTVDIDPWQSKAGPWLTEQDIHSGRVTQMVCDMKSDAVFVENIGSLALADLIFVDGPKDGFTEQFFLDLLDGVPFANHPVIVFDDIRLMNMVGIWRGIRRPKMDLTSFGHWSGTGLVDWSEPERSVPSRAAPTIAVRTGAPESVLMLCDGKPNYVPDLLLHGLRKILGPAVVDFPRKTALYEGFLGQAYLDRIPDLMARDDDVDRTDIRRKLANGHFALVLCDVRAVRANRDLLDASICPLALIDGEDRPVKLTAGNYVLLRRETDGTDGAVPLPMAMPAELLDWIDRHAGTPKTRSIAFLGSRSALTPDRNAMLDELSRIFPDALVESWGVSNGQWQGRDAYYRAMQSSRAVLNLPGAGLDTFRYWENAACNSAHVAKRMELMIPGDFREGQEILRFSVMRELIDAVERVVTDALDWRAMAAQSREWLRRHHTTDRRATDTLTRIGAAFAQ